MGNRQLPEQQAFRYDEQPQQRQRSQMDQQIIRPGQDQRRSTRGQYPPASPHRAGHFSDIHPEDAPYMTGDMNDVCEGDSYYPQRSHTSIRRYDIPNTPTQGNIRYKVHPVVVHTTIPPRRSAQAATGTGAGYIDDVDVPVTKPKRQRRGLHFHALFYLGVGVIAMLALWVGLQMFFSWWQVHQDDATYGRPRTYQFDAVFGHNDSAANPTHIIIVNLNRRIIVIELPGGDPTHARIYSGPTLFGDGQDFTPATSKAIDVNGDGKLDLVLYVQDQRIVFINDGTQFRPLKPGEQVNIPK
jgi:hypothetical protein